MTPIDSNNKTLHKMKHPAGFLQFVEWFTLPDELRLPQTQKKFSKEIGVGEDTLSAWKKRKGFFELVHKKRKLWARERTANVISAFYNKVVKNPTAPEVKLWLEFSEGWNSETKEIYGNGHQCVPILMGTSDSETDQMYLRRWARNHGYVKADGFDEDDEENNEG